MACLQQRPDLAKENFQVRQGVCRKLPQWIVGLATQFCHEHVPTRPLTAGRRQPQLASEFCRGHVVPIPKSEKLPSS